MGAIALIVVSVVVLGWLLMSRGATAPSASAQAVTSSQETTTTSASSLPTQAVVAATEPLSEVRGVRELPGGLLCVDLRAAGYGYSAALKYWVLHSRPDRMDENLNGVPCQTVFLNGDVLRHFAEVAKAQSGELDVESLPAGLMCRDLFAVGMSYADAVSYWARTGSPALMDVDVDGTPCETVYPYEDVAAYLSPSIGQPNA